MKPSVSAKHLAEKLASGLEVMGLEAVTVAQRDLLVRYLLLLQRWNATHNLTAVRDPLAMVSRHLLDSLALLPLLPAGRIVDIGSGAGLPGIPLAICRPQSLVVLVEPAAKRVAFLRTVIAELGLANLQVVPYGSEAYQPEALPDVIVSRATAPLVRLDTMTRHLQGAQTLVLALKGPGVEDEIAEWPRASTLCLRRHALCVPDAPPRTLLMWSASTALP